MSTTFHLILISCHLGRKEKQTSSLTSIQRIFYDISLSDKNKYYAKISYSTHVKNIFKNGKYLLPGWFTSYFSFHSVYF